jgi:hypothetical protein
MKIVRNEPCICGSGKKYKKCCLGKEKNAVTETALNLQEDDEDDEFDLYEGLLKITVDIHRRRLNRKPHIREYKKIRKMHEEIIGGMTIYYDEGKFEHKFANPYVSEEKGNPTELRSVQKPIKLRLLEADFDMESREGSHAFYDMLVYKCAPNANCITEEFIKNRRYRKPEKMEFLQSMLDSKLGLYEITGIDSEDGYAYLKEVFTGEEYKMTDTGLSYSNSDLDVYLYTRIITYSDIAFTTGFSLFFKKADRFIQDFIKREKKDYQTLGEYVRFIELYNRFSKDSKRIRVIGQ